MRPYLHLAGHKIALSERTSFLHFFFLLITPLPPKERQLHILDVFRDPPQPLLQLPLHLFSSQLSQ